MLGRHRSGTRVADAHPVVKGIFEAARIADPSAKGLLSLGPQNFAGQDRGALGSVPQDSFCARSPVRVASAVVLCCHAGQLFLSMQLDLVRAIHCCSR